VQAFFLRDTEESAAAVVRARGADATAMAMLCCYASPPSGITKWHKHVYLFGFFGTLLASWILRDRVDVTSSLMPGLKHCGEPGHAGCDHEVVTRVSLGTALFFITLAVVMWDSPDQEGWRHAQVHRGSTASWLVKLSSWIGSILLAFAIPGGSRVTDAYFETARVGAAAFLLVQLVVLLGAVYETNDRWLAKAMGLAETDSNASEARKYQAFLVAASVGLYSVAALFVAYAATKYVRGCSENAVPVAVIVVSLVCILITTLVSLRKDVRAGVFTSGAVAAYLAYQATSALVSLPADAKCADGIGNEALEIFGLVLALLALAVSVRRAGDSHATFVLDGRRGRVSASAAAAGAPATAKSAGESVGTLDDGFGLRDARPSADEAKGTPCSPPTEHPAAATYFHSVFAMAAMYGAMAMVGWKKTEEGDVSANALNQGWGSFGVKIGAAILGALAYLWTLVVPLWFPNRAF
jgi:hypothetical protein